MNEIDAIQETERIMSMLGIMLRDTWTGWDGINLDDFYANSSYDGERRFRIEQNSGVDRCQVTANKRYSIPGYNHLAYDDYVIQIPERMKDRRDAIIHETVHFLQANSNEEELGYINFNGSNYLDYISQRTEVEAHVVQILFLIEIENQSIPSAIVDGVKSDRCTDRIEAILSAKKCQLI